jgi:glutamyl-tRNA(Gln) amidotransferase subunit E
MYNFIFKPFEEMAEEDYAAVGFKSGLEIHQQLLTEKKLFCRCPAGQYSEKYDAEILRHMRPTLSELGEYDGTALMEFKTKKEIIYRINRETVCTYEMDDTPPFLINENALDIGLGIGLLYGCNVIDELHIARKQYLDGSIPTGFQRTAIFALDGRIPYKGREIKIIQVSIEEDACREVSDIGHQRVYLTDRLGMPLVETVTGPDMRTPFEVAEVAQICRRLVRSTGKVRTGIGAAREDVNVSVTGGTRIEIKGVPKIKKIPILTYNEAMRQWNLLRLREELKKRGITSDTFKAESEDITKVIRIPHYLPIKNAVEKGWQVKCVVLRGFSGLLNWQTQTGTYFSKEISDRSRVIACLSTIPNIIHSDGKGETLTSFEWQKIKKAVNANDDDTLVIVWGDERDSETAVREIVIRAKEATVGIPSETRQALSDGTNGFERILPGPDRMYPDTDLPPKNITIDRIEKIKSELPDPVWEREKWYHELKIPEDTIEELSVSKYAGLFKYAVNELKIDPILASVALIQFPKKLLKKKLRTGLLSTEVMKKIFEALKERKIVKDGIFHIMENFLITGILELEQLFEPATPEEILFAKEQSLFEMKNINIIKPENKQNILLGMVMDKLRGKVNGADVEKQVNYISEETK